MLLPDGTGYLKNDASAAAAGATRRTSCGRSPAPPRHRPSISAGVLGADPTAAAFHARDGPVHAFAITVEQHRAVSSQSTHDPFASRHAAEPTPRVPLSGVPFGVYVHIPFCAHAVRLLRLRDLDRPCAPDRRLRRRVRHATSNARHGRAPPAATSVFFGGGTPSLLPARRARADPRRDRRDRRRRGHGRVQPRQRRRREARRLSRAPASTALSFGVQSMVPHVLAALGRTHDPANVDARGRAARARRVRALNVDLIYGTPGESLDDWRATLDGALALERRARERVRADRRAGHAARPARRRGRAPAPDDDDQADKYLIADERARRRRLRVVRDLELGAARARSAATTSLLERGRVPRRSGAPPTATPTAAAGGTCARPSATSRRIAARRVDRKRASETLDPDAARRGGVRPRVCAPAAASPAAPRAPGPRSTSCARRGLVERRGGAGRARRARAAPRLRRDRALLRRAAPVAGTR